MRGLPFYFYYYYYFHEWQRKTVSMVTANHIQSWFYSPKRQHILWKNSMLSRIWLELFTLLKHELYSLINLTTHKFVNMLKMHNKTKAKLKKAMKNKTEELLKKAILLSFLYFIIILFLCFIISKQYFHYWL